MKANKIIGFVVVVIILSIIIFSLFRMPGIKKENLGTDNSISLIKLEGEIGRSSLTSSFITPEEVKTLLEEAKKSLSRGLVIRIDSPGGEVEPTEEIYALIQTFKEETGKRVYISMGSTAASGGYYIACTGDKIFAMPSTITGSIGVIIQLIDYQELLSKIGIKEKIIKSGTFKDMGSPTRSLTGEEEVMFKNIIEEEYQMFLNVVSKGRKIDLDKLKEIAQGQIYIGSQAKSIGLIDEIGSLEQTINSLAKDIGIMGEPVIIEHKIPKSIFSIFSSIFNSNVNLLKGLKPFEIQYILVTGD